MTFQEAIKILASRFAGGLSYFTSDCRVKAAARVAQELTTKFDDDGLVQWIYNGDYTGEETVASMQAELDEVETE